MRELTYPFVLYVFFWVFDFFELLSATAQTAKRKFEVTTQSNKGRFYNTIATVALIDIWLQSD